MLIQPTIDALNRLKLHGMAIALSEQMTNTAAQQLAFEERIALLLEREVTHLENRAWDGCGQLASRRSAGRRSRTSITADAGGGRRDNQDTGSVTRI